ncbi:MAG TPA: hypothetical protein VMT63_04210 [Bacteroidales bacterium]|nr:hypothetical protein [Bacteroidales bacterium]
MRATVINMVLLSAMITGGGCTDSRMLNVDQKVLYMYSFTNSPAAQKNQGIIIDSRGNILLFDQPRKWNLPDKNSTLTGEQVDENLAQCKSTGLRIPETELLKFSGYIDNLASSRVSALKSITSGRGTYYYCCFSFNAASGIYKQVTIREHGDTDCENLNFYSRKVVEWINLLIKDLPVQHP